MTKIIARGAVGGLLLLAATACSSAPGTPSPASSSAPIDSAPNVPQVTSPLDVGKYEQDPCAVLSKAQATEVFQALRNRTSSGNFAPRCTWYDSKDNSISISFLPGQGGLSTSYKNGAGAGGYFEAAPDVSGYPAVYSAVLDDRKSGGCQIGVGVKNDEIFTFSAILDKASPSYGDPCSLVTRAAEAAVATIKAGA
ncbi:uncharacterized protein DUF3558 [Amycolatopsis sulphurea]|uniref:Uncharacterized protein DUF3558 n=1 Tax=Amycolatopsis sulphurea TaxID=76022 RepID=A0A2A9FCD8_9PSEU|nr:DUF3558 domain-containing protein [Amycolatopsis sulphurea]PFG48446.1 uncharacterized protein DUF3558 [Amycolatopsis sulphurea]